MSAMKRRPTCSLECGAQARRLKQQWQNTVRQLQAHCFMYADQQPTFDGICGTFRLDPAKNAIDETLGDGTALRYELTADERLFPLGDLSELEASELPGSAVASPCDGYFSLPYYSISSAARSFPRDTCLGVNSSPTASKMAYRFPVVSPAAPASSEHSTHMSSANRLFQGQLAFTPCNVIPCPNKSGGYSMW